MWWLLACVAEEDCPSGSARADDGRCYGETETEAAPSFDDVVASLPACEPREGDGRIDLEAACVDGACAHQSYAEMRAALGDATCDGWVATQDRSAVYVRCEWDIGIVVYFPALPEPDEHGDFVLDPDVPTPWALGLSPTYEGRTADGLGVDSELACWLDALGGGELAYAEEDGELYVRAASWETPSVSIYETGRIGPPYNVDVGGGP